MGTALKTTSLRLRGTDVKVLEEEGLDSEGAATSTSKLRSKVMALSGVDILTETGEYKSTYEILSDIADVWESMNDMDQAALLELISGKRNSSVIAAILQNPKELKAAFEDANNASGSALKENEKYLDSIQGKIDQFNNALQTMWSNTLDSGVVKFFVDLATSLVKIVDKFGLINTLVFGLMSYLTVFKKDKLDLASILGIHDIEKGWTFGKEGLTGKIKNAFTSRKQKSSTEVSADNLDVKTDRELLIDEVSKNIDDYMTLNTSKIDSQIYQLQDKLNIAQNQLKDAQSYNYDVFSESPKTSINKVTESDSIKTPVSDLNAIAKKVPTEKFDKLKTDSDQVETNLENATIAATEVSATSLDQPVAATAQVETNLENAAIAAMETSTTSLNQLVTATDSIEASMENTAIAAREASISNFNQLVTAADNVEASMESAAIATKEMSMVNPNQAIAPALNTIPSARTSGLSVDEMIESIPELNVDPNQFNKFLSTEMNEIRQRDIFYAEADLEWWQKEFPNVSFDTEDTWNTHNGARFYDVLSQTEEYKNYDQKPNRKNRKKLDDVERELTRKLLEHYEGKNIDEIVAPTLPTTKSELNPDNMTSEEVLGEFGLYGPNNNIPKSDLQEQIPVEDTLDSVLSDIPELKIKGGSTDEIQKMITGATELKDNVDEVNAAFEETPQSVKDVSDAVNDTPVTKFDEVASGTNNLQMEANATANAVEEISQNTGNVSTEKIDDATSNINDLTETANVASNALEETSQSAGAVDSAINNVSAEGLNEVRNDANNLSATLEETSYDVRNVDNALDNISSEGLDKAALNANELEQEAIEASNAIGTISQSATNTDLNIDKNNRIAQKTEEIKGLKAELESLQAQRNHMVRDAATNYVDNNMLASNTNKESAFLNIFEHGLPQGTEKLTYDTQELSAELDKISKLDNAGVINYMQSLDDLGGVGDNTKKVLAGYASTVEDGNYSVQGARKYVDQYNQALGRSSKSATRAKLGQMGLNLAISYVTMALTSLITKIVELATNGQKKFDELSSQISETESKLKDINSQLDETSNRIQELQEQGVLTFTDKEELERLRAQTRELERQKQLTESMQQQQQKGLNEAATDAAKQYKKTGIKSGKTTGERSGQGAIVGAGVGSAAAGMALTATGGAAGLAGLLGVAGTANGWNPVGWGLLIAAGIVAISAAIGAGIGAASGMLETKVGESMENMREEQEKLQQKYEKKRQKFASKGGNGRRKRMEKASEELESYEAMMANHFAEMDQYYSSIDLSVYDSVRDADTIERLRTEMNEFYDTRDKWLIQSGAANAKSNAISRIFGENASQELKDIKKEIQDAMKLGEDFNFNEAFDDDFKNRLHSMGLTVAEVKGYFKELKKSEDEAAEFSTEDAVKAVANLADKVETLKGAFDEFNETGILTAKTLVSLSETFGSMGNKWTNFVDMMASGAVSTEEAKEAMNELIEALITSALAGEKIDTEQYVVLWSQLTNLGVNNATELLDGIKEYSSIGEQISKEVVDGKKTIDDAIAEYEKANNTTLSEKQKQVVHATYEAKEAKSKVETYETQEKSLESLLSAYETAKEKEAELDEVYTDALNTKSGKHLGMFGKRQKKEDKEKVKTAEANLDAATEDTVSIKNQIESLYREVFITDEQVAQYRESMGKLALGQSDDRIRAEIAKDKNFSDKVLALQTYFEEPQNYDELFDETQDTLDNLENELRLNVDFEFEDPNELVDDIQSVFDTLVNAKKEYNESGYFTVDTMQSLLEMDAKYLDLLIDENGNLNLNEQALYNVAIARLTDLKLKQQDAILTEAEKLAARGTIDALYSQVDAMYGEVDAYDVLIKKRLDSIRTLLEERKALADGEEGKLDSSFNVDTYINGLKGQLDAVERVSQSAISNIHNSLSSTGNTASAETEDAFQKAMEYWENRIGANQSLYEQIQNDIELLEKQGKIAGESYYQGQMEVENQHLELLKKKRAEALTYLRTFAEGSEEWWDVQNTLNDIANEIDSVTASLQDLSDAIAQVHWTIFDEAHERMEDLKTQLSNVREILSTDEDSFFNDEGEWTETGVAVLATYVQELELYKSTLADIENELKAFEESYEGNEDYYKTMGIDSENEYYDKLTELTEKQHDYTMAINDSEQSVVDMYESSVDAIEEYTQTLVDSYNDYIDSVKEALDAERDLYDFKKNVQKQAKDIAEIERRIVSLSGSTNKADIAERRKLEAQLYESRESLNDTYYDHAKDAQNEALDAEQTAYEESMTKFIEGLRTSLEEATRNMDEFLMSVTSMVTLNADTVLDKYEDTELLLSPALTNPWEKAKAASNSYSGDALALMNEWTKDDGFFDKFNTSGTTNLTSPWNAGKTAAQGFATSIQNSMNAVYESVKSNVKHSVTALEELKKKYAEIGTTTARAPSAPSGNALSSGVTSAVNALPKKFHVTATLDVGTKVFSATGVHGEDGEAADLALKSIQDQYYDYHIKQGKQEEWIFQQWKRAAAKIKYSPSEYYAQGTTGTKRDEWAITDEPWLGDELVLVPTAQGNLSYMRKGTGVVPADLTANLMEWGKFTPDSLNLGTGVNINMINNAVNKPEFNFAFDALVKAENITEETLPAVKKLVTQELNRFTKELNYALKGKGAR